MATTFVVRLKKRPRTHHHHLQAGLRRAELSFVAELRHEANRRANYQLQLQSINSMMTHLYNPAMQPRLKARRAHLMEAARESMGG